MVSQLGSQAKSQSRDSWLKLVEIQLQKFIHEKCVIYSIILNSYQFNLGSVIQNLFNGKVAPSYPKPSRLMPIGTLQILQNTVKRPKRLLHTSQVLWTVADKPMLKMNHES